jgi:hypothetical protein
MYRLMGPMSARPVYGAGQFVKFQQYRQSDDMAS